MRGNTLGAGLASTLVASLALTSLGCASDDAPEDSKSDPFAGEWVTLVDAEWSLPPGKEGYTCARVTVQEDMYIRAYRPIDPVGTHHTLASVGPDTTGRTEDEIFPCSFTTNGPRMLFGSGVGTTPIAFPHGVAMKIPKGEKILLNLHLYNTTSAAELTGRSGLEVQVVDPSEVVYEAETVLAGKLGGLTVVPGVSTQSGSCEMSHDVTLFAVFPHMHQLGIHLKATAQPSGGEPRVLVDHAYSFEDQVYYPIQPTLEMKTGDVVTVDCTYDNPGDTTITWGDSSDKEMCFAGLYRYPKAAEGEGRFACSTGGGSWRLDGPPCAEEGATGNELGVGRYCTAAGSECGPEAALCLAKHVQGDFPNFCTTMCAADADCGTGARCIGGASGTAICLPDSCEMPTPTEATGL